MYDLYVGCNWLPLQNISTETAFHPTLTPPPPIGWALPHHPPMLIWFLLLEPPINHGVQTTDLVLFKLLCNPTLSKNPPRYQKTSETILLPLLIYSHCWHKIVRPHSPQNIPDLDLRSLVHIPPLDNTSNLLRNIYSDNKIIRLGTCCWYFVWFYELLSLSFF